MTAEPILLYWPEFIIDFILTMSSRFIAFMVTTVGAASLLVGCGSLTNSNTSGDLAEGSVIQYGTTTYVYSEGVKRGITTPEVFEGCGYKWEDVRLLTQTEFETIPDGEVVSQVSDCPQ